MRKITEILRNRKQTSLREWVTLLVVVLALVSVFYSRTDYHVFFLGENQDVVSVPIDNETEIRIEVKNNQRITIQEMTFRFVNNGIADYGQGSVRVELLSTEGAVLGNGIIGAAEILQRNARLVFDEMPEIGGNFVISLKGENFEEGTYASIGISRMRDIANPSELKGITYRNGEQIEGLPEIALGIMLRDNLYFPALALLAVILLVVHFYIVIKKKGFFEKHLGENTRVKILVFLVLGGYLLYELWSNHNQEICSWMGPWYVLDYGIGMGSRLFIGTIMKVLFYDTFLDKSIVIYFVLAALSVLVLEIAYLMAECIANAKNEHRRGIAVILLFYLASPGAVGYLWTGANMGRLETYLFMLALVSVAVNVAIKNRLLKYGILAALSVCMFAIHQVNLFTYFMVIFMLCICNVFQEHRISWKDFWGSLVVALTSGVTFVYFHFFSYVNFETAEEMVEYVGERTNLRNNASGIYLEYFSGQFGMFENCFAADNYRINGVFQILVLWPLAALGLFIGVQAIRYWRGKKINWLCSPYLYLFLFNLIYIPVFTFECDWARWFAAIITTKTIEFLYLYYIREQGMVYAVEQLSAWLKKKEWCIAMVLLYLTSLEKFGSAQFLDVVERLYAWLFPFIA